ncbi:STAS domain-containing protein [Marinobacterium sediminicola]|uniref:Anti-anti-sigma factor n=1 Tax=Marinobacterium sediminicola TaxID=518898 RepID=A0ABY1S3Z3_9GAMM|nr:STAS domain-containing protein [Marinobacterium sediminicola]ULG68208.1 STAS domain-containing protein [Marinobacterium sediminicola]SMR77735.1 anti-anti-sigma factor [Marinobacterium sediminicola]
MGLEIKQDETRAVVDVQDEMTIYTAALHWDELKPLLAKVKAIEINLSAVSEIDSAGVQLLLALMQESERLHNQFLLRDPADEVQALLKLLHLDQQLLPARPDATQEGVQHG